MQPNEGQVSESESKFDTMQFCRLCLAADHSPKDSNPSFGCIDCNTTRTHLHL